MISKLEAFVQDQQKLVDTLSADKDLDYFDAEYLDIQFKVLERAKVHLANEKAEQADKDKGLVSELKEWADTGLVEKSQTQRELLEILSRHQSNPIDPDYNKNKVAMNGHGIPVCPECGTKIEACGDCADYAEFKAWKSAKDNCICGGTGFVMVGHGGNASGECCPDCTGSSLAPKPEAKTESSELRQELSDLVWSNTDPIAEVWKKKVRAILSRHPATLEPLEDLANRKGCSVGDYGRVTSNLYIRIVRDQNGNDKTFEGCTPLCPERAARKWLGEQEDKK